MFEYSIVECRTVFSVDPKLVKETRDSIKNLELESLTPASKRGIRKEIANSAKEILEKIGGAYEIPYFSHRGQREAYYRDGGGIDIWLKGILVDEKESKEIEPKINMILEKDKVSLDLTCKGPFHESGLLELIRIQNAFLNNFSSEKYQIGIDLQSERYYLAPVTGLPKLIEHTKNAYSLLTNKYQEQEILKGLRRNAREGDEEMKNLLEAKHWKVLIRDILEVPSP